MISAASQNESLTNLTVRYGEHKLAVQIMCLLLKQQAGKKQHPLSQKVRLAKSSSLEFSCTDTEYLFNLSMNNPPVK